VACRTGPEMVVPLEHRCALRTHALGQPQVHVDGQSVQWPYAKSMELYFCPLQHPEACVARPQAPCSGRIAHRRSWMASSSTLSASAKPSIATVSLGNGLYRIGTPKRYWLDVEASDDLVDRSERSRSRDNVIPLLEEALELYRGPYLEGIDGRLALVERRPLEMRYLSSTEQLAGLCADRGQLESPLACGSNCWRRIPAGKRRIES